MLLELVATACAGLFSGAAIYINAVEHPARLGCGVHLALREFAPSYHRAAIMQASLAVAGTVAGLAAAWQQGAADLAVAALLLGAVVPFTLIVIRPVNQRLLDPGLAAADPAAQSLLRRWGRLHAVRSALSLLAFVLFLV